MSAAGQQNKKGERSLAGTLDTILASSGKWLVDKACEAAQQAPAQGTTPFSEALTYPSNAALLPLLALLTGKVLVECNTSQAGTDGSKHSAGSAEDPKAPDEAKGNANELSLPCITDPKQSEAILRKILLACESALSKRIMLKVVLSRLKEVAQLSLRTTPESSLAV